jgi:3-oxoacyl-[acyl-carrier protein] reductase
MSSNGVGDAGKPARPVAVVTGAGQGIGRAITLRFAAGGYDVVAIDRNRATAAETAELVRAAGARATALECDVADRTQVRAAFRQIDGEYGRIDVLVNNAAVFIRETIEKSTDEVIDTTIGVNFRGVLDCSRAAIPIMKRHHGGCIINAASILGHFPDVGLGVYGMTKIAVSLLTRVLAAELAPYGIRCNAYQPAMTDTPMVHHIIEERPDDKLTQIPLRQFGKPEQMADLCWFLASPEAEYITGQVVPCDGGIWAVQRPMKAWQEADVEIRPYAQTRT